MGILLYTPLTVEFYQRERGARAGNSIFFEFKQKLNDKKKMAPAIKGEKKNDQVRREAPLYLAIIQVTGRNVTVGPSTLNHSHGYAVK